MHDTARRTLLCFTHLTKIYCIIHCLVSIWFRCYFCIMFHSSVSLLSALFALCFFYCTISQPSSSVSMVLNGTSSQLSYFCSIVFIINNRGPRPCSGLVIISSLCGRKCDAYTTVCKIQGFMSHFKHLYCFFLTHHSIFKCTQMQKLSSHRHFYRHC